MNFIALIFFGFLTVPAIAERAYLTFPSDIEWKTQKSPHFQILFRKGQAGFAQRALQAAEKAHRLLTPLFPDSPPLTSIVLADFNDSLNGYSLNFPYHHFVIYGVPPDSTSELSELDDWLDSVVLHEYAHTLHLYPAGGLWKLFRTIFGTTIVPNGMLPQHFHEGLATFLETEFTRGGRGKGPTFEMMLRKTVENKTWEHDPISLDLLDGSFNRWPQGRSAYFFGYYFYRHLWKLKEKEGLYDLTVSSSENWPYWVNRPIREVFGTDISSLWNDLQKKEILEQNRKIKEIKSSPLSSLTYFTKTGFQKSRLVESFNKEKIAYLSENPESGRNLVSFEYSLPDSHKKTPLLFSESSGLCYQNKSSKDTFILSSPFELNGYSFNRLSAFQSLQNHFFHLKTASGFIDHVREFDCHPELTAYVIYQDSGGKGELKVFQGPIPGPNRNLTERFVWKLPEGTWISSVLFGSPHHFLLRHGMTTSLYSWAPPENPQFLGSLKGHAFHLRKSSEESLLLVTSLSQRYEVWKWILPKSELVKMISVVGGVNSFIEKAEGFLVSSYEDKGYDIALASKLDEAAQTVSKASTANPAESVTKEVSTHSSAIQELDYSPWSSLIPRTWIPSALFVPFGFQVGAWIPSFDLSQKHFYDINIGLDQRDTDSGKKRLPMASLFYGYRFGESSQLDLNTYFSPGFLTLSKSFFKQWGASLGYSWRFWNALFQIRFSALFRRLETSTLGPANQSAGLGVGWGWTSRNSIDAFNPQLNRSGITASINHQQYIKEFGSEQSYFNTVLNVESALTNPLWNQSLFTLNLRQGYTEGTPFYNSFFQGGGEILFSPGREFFLNRGYLQGSFIGRRMFGGNFEFRFPISQIERGISLLPLFLNNISGAIVLDTTSFDFGSLSSAPRVWMKEFLWSTGFELNTRWKLFYYLPTTIRLGAYRGLSVGGEPFYFTLGLEASL